MNLLVPFVSLLVIALLTARWPAVARPVIATLGIGLLAFGFLAGAMLSMPSGSPEPAPEGMPVAVGKAVVLLGALVGGLSSALAGAALRQGVRTKGAGTLLLKVAGAVPFALASGWLLSEAWAFLR